MWTECDIQKLNDRNAIVTGANSGIGFETARVLASKGTRVILACRDIEKGKEAASRIQDAHPDAEIEVMTLDLSNLASVHTFADSFTSSSSTLDILCNNAGVMMIPKKTETADGFEMQFGTNHLGHFALTGLLFDALRNTPGARVITVSSIMERFGKIDFENLNSERKYNPSDAYSASKLANLLFTYEMQRLLEGARMEMLAASAHPGWTGTNLQRHAPFFRFMNRFVSQKPRMGALPTLYAATAPDVKGGNYLGPDRLMGMRGYPKNVKSSDASHNEEIARSLWVVSEELTGVRYDF